MFKICIAVYSTYHDIPRPQIENYNKTRIQVNRVFVTNMQRIIDLRNESCIGSMG